MPEAAIAGLPEGWFIRASSAKRRRANNATAASPPAASTRHAELRGTLLLSDMADEIIDAAQPVPGELTSTITAEEGAEDVPAIAPRDPSGGTFTVFLDPTICHSYQAH